MIALVLAAPLMPSTNLVIPKTLVIEIDCLFINNTAFWDGTTAVLLLGFRHNRLGFIIQTE